MQIAEAATRFLDSLDDEQRALASASFDDEAVRRDWHYIPRRRPGLSFRRMSAEQEQHVYALVSTMLSTHAFAQVATIIALEDVLDVIEGGHRNRHRADYSTIVFGEPGSSPWGIRFEGHHVSVNVTAAGDEVASTPLFLGANPAVVAGATRPLEREEVLARRLLDLVGSDAVVPGDAPEDILTTALPTLGGAMPEPAGVRRADLVDGGEAASTFDALVDTYVDRSPFSRPVDHGDTRFAWMGSARPGEPHYYRLQGPRFLVEYDNTQNDANHIHTVVRDPDDDFGDDLLRRHLAADH